MLSGVFRMCDRRRPRGSRGRKSPNPVGPSGIWGKAPVGGLGTKAPEADAFLLMPTFWCFGGKIRPNKTAKYTIIKKFWSAEGGGAGASPPKYATGDVNRTRIREVTEIAR